ncbi:hypothetical protein, partial [Serratia marcescens]
NSYSSYTYDANGNLKSSRAYAGSIALPGTVGATPPSPPASSYRETFFNYDALDRLTWSKVAGIVSGNYASGYAAADLVTYY